MNMDEDTPFEKIKGYGTMFLIGISGYGLINAYEGWGVAYVFLCFFWWFFFWFIHREDD
jgi:hypothetical protein